MEKQPSKRIQLWDEMRGVAILCMVMAHFSYVETATFDGLTIGSFLDRVDDFPRLVLYFVHANASFLAPFLFYFLVGVMCNIKFKKINNIEYNKTISRASRLIIGTLAVNTIFLLRTPFPQNMELLKHLVSPNVLFYILLIYLFNELILHNFIHYFKFTFRSKTCCITAVTALCFLYNITASNVGTYRDLSWPVSMALGIYASLLGDYFTDIKATEKHIRALVATLAAGALALIFYLIAHPPVDALKKMSVSYYLYCFGAAAAISFVLLKLEKIQTAFIRGILAALALMGRHSLVLYGVHYLVGLLFFRLVLSPFVPDRYWWISVVIILTACWLTARLLESRPLMKKRAS
ncbi:hypothetical protein [Desulfovibrio sp. Fe33]|uniref:hypothetical protein n=1 Tax=Desulfovibrio sp. Fe33 TaxID=3020842 RepID=UPI00234E2A86|nr:hypothetical protein [Desulfovibrio sp. Fe33]